jgi:hypothetical protein
MNRPTLLMVPCFAGAPWALNQLTALQGWPLRTLPDPAEVVHSGGELPTLTPKRLRLSASHAVLLEQQDVLSPLAQRGGRCQPADA